MAEPAQVPSGLRAAATLLLALGEEPAAEVLKHLTAKEVQKVGSVMSSVGPLTRAEVSDTLTRMLAEADAQSSVAGSDEYIRSVLTNALGAEKAGGLLDRILLGQASKGLETLKWMDSRAIWEHLRNEHPQTMAVVLAYLDADQAGEVLTRFSESQRADILARVALLEGLQPHALRELDEIIERQFAVNASSRTATLGGAKTAANILNTLDQGVGESILGDIRSADEPLAARLEELIFTFHDLLELEDRDMQELLRAVPGTLLVPALKAADETLRSKLMKSMSSRAAEMLRDDIEASGPIRLADAEAAQKEIVAAARKLADDGKITLGRSAQTYV